MLHYLGVAVLGLVWLCFGWLTIKSMKKKSMDRYNSPNRIIVITRNILIVYQIL
jgi:hypothetical protein